MKRQKRFSRKWLIYLIIFPVIISRAAGLTLSAQTFPFREYASEDGLPQLQSMDVMQDSRGYLWIPTRNGLARFDGHSFISYLRKDGLPSNLVTRVVEDKSGTIWAVTLNGMARFNGKHFISYPIPDSLGIKQMGMGCLAGDSASFFLNAAIDYNNFAIIFFDNGRYLNFSEKFPVLKTRRFIPAAANPHDSVLYLLDTWSNAYAFKKGTLKMIHPCPVTGIRIVDDEPVFSTAEPALLPDVGPFHWEGGVLAFRFIDHEGTNWVGTETSIYRLMSEAFVEYDKEDGLPEGTWAVAADPDSGLWLGSVYGELKYFDGERFSERKNFRLPNGPARSFYRGSATLSNGEVWLSTGRGVIIWDGRQFRDLDLLPENLQICTIYEDPVDRSVFIGTDRGLFVLEGRKVTWYDQMSWPGYGTVEGVIRDLDGNHWLAGHYGMVFFDGNKFVPYRSAPAPAEMVWGMVCDYKGNIWSVGSDGIVICKHDPMEFREGLPHELNLPANVIRDMGDRKLLVGRMMDICIIDLDKYYSGWSDYYTVLGSSRGFRGNDCQDNGIVKDSGGNWWILTTGKLIRFNPDKIQRNNRPPMNHITMAEIPGGKSDWQTVLDSSLFYNGDNHINIRGRKNGIRISYTGISTVNPEDVTYQYRMTGLEGSWSKRTGEREAVYSDMPPGSYTFEVRAINADGVISESPDRLGITVMPTFFQSLFARLTIIILSLLFVFLLSWQIRKSVLEKRVEEARRQAESYRFQLNSVIKQFDPHFTFNAVTSVGSLIMKGEKEKAYNYFIKLSNLLRSIITDSTVLLKPLEQELEFVSRYCELQKLRFGDRFEYRITVSANVVLNTPVPKMIIQSFAENAIKHGLENKKGHGEIEILVNSLDEGIEVIVRDNGIGRAAASRMNTGGAGTGLKNIANIIQTINKANREKITFTLTDLNDNGRPSGTEVRIFLPQNYSLDFDSGRLHPITIT
jgi:hypothetical protein